MMMMIRATVYGLIFVSCGAGFSSRFHLGQRPIISRPYATYSITALPMAPDFDEQAREEAVAKYIAKTNEETMQALKRLEQEKDEQVRALQQKLADLLNAKSSNVMPPSIVDASSSSNFVDSTIIRQQEIELQVLKLKVEELKQHVAANAFSNIRDEYSGQNSILNDFISANDFSTGSPRTETTDVLVALRLRLARLEGQLIERLRQKQQQQQQQQQYPPSSPINTPGQEFSNVENQPSEIQTLRTRINNLVQKVFGMDRD